MKALKYVFFLLLILIIGSAIYVAVQPNSFEVSRQRHIEAPNALVFNTVNNLKNWEKWSVWQHKAPQTSLTYADTTQGVHAAFRWTDSKGSGSLKTKSINLNEHINQSLQINNHLPWALHWNFTPTEGHTSEVKLTLKSEQIPFMFKAKALYSGGFDKMFGPDFERALKQLDSVITAAMKEYKINVEGVTQHSGGFYLYNTTSCKISELDTKMKEMLPKVGGYALSHNVTTAGPPFVYYHKWDEANNAVIFSCCIPTTSQVITDDDSEILTGQLESFRAVETTLNGNYTNLKEAWEKTMKYIPENGLEFAENGPMLESYITDPTSKPNPADWITKIYIAVKE